MALNATFIADFSSFLTATKDSIAAMTGFQNTAMELGPATDRGLDASAKSMEAIGQATQRLTADVVRASQSFIDAYAEDEAAVSRLTSALEASGQATPAVLAQYDALATGFQKTTKYSDDAITEVITKLTTVGKIGPEQMGLAVEATTNLASHMKIDLATAAKLVADAVATGGEKLGRMKTEMQGIIEPGQSTAEILGHINEKTGGAAAAELDTYAGQVAHLKNEMGSFDEQVGQVLVTNLTAVLHVFESLPDGVQTFVLAVVGIGTALAPVLVSLAALVSILSTAGVGAALATALGALLVPLAAVAAAVGAVYLAWRYWDQIVGIVKAIYEGVKAYIVDGLEALLAPIQAIISKVAGAFAWLHNVVVGHSIVPDMMDGIGQEFGRLDGLMVSPVVQATQLASQHFEKLGATIDNFAETFKSYTAMFGGLQEAGTGIWGPVPKDLLSYALEQGRARFDTSPTLAPGAGLAAAASPVNVAITMNGMLGTDDPQTKNALRQVVGDALMDGMRGQRLLSSA